MTNTQEAPKPAPASARLRDWQSRLAAVVLAAHERPFEWGVHDCCTFAADCAHACTGADYGSDIRGSYANAITAAHLVKRVGGLAMLAASQLGEEISPIMAQAGDVGLVREVGETAADGWALCVMVGGHWAAPGASGLRALNAASVERAWRVCRG